MVKIIQQSQAQKNPEDQRKVMERKLKKEIKINHQKENIPNLKQNQDLNQKEKVHHLQRRDPQKKKNFKKSKKRNKIKNKKGIGNIA